MEAIRKVVDEQRQKIAQAQIADANQQTEYYNAIGRSESMSSGLLKQGTKTTQDTLAERRKAYQEALRDIENRYQEERLLLLLQHEQGEIDRATYSAKLLMAEQMFLETRLYLQRTAGESTVKTEQEIVQKRTDLQKKLQSDTPAVDLEKLAAETDKAFSKVLDDLSGQLD